MKHLQTKSRQKNARENNERAFEEEKRPKLQFKVTEFWYRQSLVEHYCLIEKKSISSTY